MRLLLSLLVFALLIWSAGPLASQPTPSPTPFQLQQIARPTPVPGDQSTWVEFVLDSLGDCDLAGAAILCLYDHAKSEPLAGQLSKRQLVDILERYLTDVLTEAGLRTVTGDLAAMAGGNTERVMVEREFASKAQELALSYNAEYILRYYVMFKEVGRDPRNPEWYAVQDTLVYELVRVSSGERLSGVPFRAAGTSNVDYEDAHYQNMQRLVMAGLDGDLGRHLVADLKRFCERVGKRGDIMTVGLYYQGDDSLPLIAYFSEALKDRRLNRDGMVRERVRINSVATRETYAEYEIRSIAGMDNMSQYLYDPFVKEFNLRDRYRVHIDVKGMNVVLNILEEGRPEFSEATLDRLRGRPSDGSKRRTEEQKSSLEISRAALRGTALVRAVGAAETQPAAGVLVTRSGIVITDSAVATGALAFTVEFGGESGQAGHMFQASPVMRLDAYGLEILQLEDFRLPPGVEPLPLADSDRVQERDGVVAVAPRTRAYPGSVTRSGEIVGIERGTNQRIIHTAMLNEMSNGAPLMNMWGEVVGICRTNLRTAESTTQATERMDQGVSQSGSVATTVTRGVAVPVNLLRGQLPASELEEVRRK
jgi:S1-C subfamily serine protease